jgi:hypothetical protein
MWQDGINPITFSEQKQYNDNHIEKAENILQELKEVQDEFNARHNITENKQAADKKVQAKALAINTAITSVENTLKDRENMDENIKDAVKTLQISLQKHRHPSVFRRQTKSSQSLNNKESIKGLFR